MVPHTEDDSVHTDGPLVVSELTKGICATVNVCLRLDMLPSTSCIHTVIQAHVVNSGR